jgi:hypothetical protein
MKAAVVTLLLAALPCAAQVKITPGAGKVAIEIGGKPFTDFYISGAGVTKPYLHPLRAASGTYVTRMWPMEDVAEEAKTAKDHPHQRGLWFAHESVNKLDFWNNEASYTTPNRGNITLKSLGEIKSGRDSGSITATFVWTDLSGAPQLTETRVMTFYDQPNLRTVDFDITLTAVKPVTFGDSKDGTLGIRLRPVLQESAQRGDEFQLTGRITNADGLVTEKEAWGKPSRWCDYSGSIAGEKLGIAILDHPGNRRSPVRWHVRGYGLFAANPFGISVFTNDKTQDGSVSIGAGESLRYRYRVVIHPGDAASANIESIWKQYAAGK